MRLELGNVRIEDVQFGEETKIESNVLYINKEELLEVAGDDEHIESVDVDLARPGESVRITPVKDVVEPRVKVDGPGVCWPGVMGGVEQVGSGRTHVLKGAAVMTVGPVVAFQEGIIDMCGPGADYTPFSETNNVVVTVNRVEGLSAHQHERACRMAGFRVAAYLAEAAREVEPDDIETYETKPFVDQLNEYPDLPRVAYVQMIQTQGLLHDTYVYGVDGKQIIPTILYPTESMDGAIISGNCVSACDKNTSFHQMNNPVVKALYGLHGKEVNFMGTIVTNENVYLMDKERSSNMTAKLAEYLGIEGAIVSQEGFGNPDTDLIMNAKKLAGKDVKTVIITDEYAGRDGASQSLADADPSADAVVTGGNANEVVILPKLDKVIGTLEYVGMIAGSSDNSMREDGSIEVELQAITGATNELGFNKMSARTL